MGIYDVLQIPTAEMLLRIGRRGRRLYSGWALLALFLILVVGFIKAAYESKCKAKGKTASDGVIFLFNLVMAILIVFGFASEIYARIFKN